MPEASRSKKQLKVSESVLLRLHRRLETLLDNLAERTSFRTLMVLLVLLVAVAYRLAKIFLANRAEPGDLETLRIGAEMAMQGKNVWTVLLPAQPPHFFTYPGGMLWMAVFIYEASQTSGFSFLHVAQLLGLTFDLLVSLMVYLILRKEPYYCRLLGVTLVIFNPFMYRNSLFKAKPDDAIMLFLILLAFDLLERGRSTLSGVVFGTSVGFKQFAVLLLPYFAVKQEVRRKNLISILAGFLLASLPGLADPWAYLRTSYLGHAYRQSVNFQWGTFAGCWDVFPWCVPVSLAIFSVAMLFIYIKFSRVDPYTFAFMIAFAFIAFYWAAWEQYFTWFVPFLVVSVMRSLPRLRPT